MLAAGPVERAPDRAIAGSRTAMDFAAGFQKYRSNQMKPFSDIPVRRYEMRRGYPFSLAIQARPRKSSNKKQCGRPDTSGTCWYRRRRKKCWTSRRHAHMSRPIVIVSIGKFPA